MAFYPKQEDKSSDPYIHPCPLRDVSSTTLGLLDRLHAMSQEQEDAITPEIIKQQGFDEYMKDKYIALDQDKCWFVYQSILASKAKTVVEAGTSFGVSTIYLALAVQRNIKLYGGEGKVIATENEPDKAMKARETWKELTENISDIIDLREGDLRETLGSDLSQVDLLLLDIWAPLALPTLKIVEKSFKPGSIVITDNSIGSAHRYQELLIYLRAPDSGYTNLTLPYSNGLEFSVYTGSLG